MAKKNIIGYQLVHKKRFCVPRGFYSWEIFRTMDALNAACANNGIKIDEESEWKVVEVYEGDIECPEYIEDNRVICANKESCVKSITNDLLSSIFTDDYDNALVTTTIIDDVITDIDETADKNFNDSDVRIAVARVLKRRLGVID